MSLESRKKLRLARIVLDTETLHQLLFLPKDMRILAEHIDPHMNSLVLLVESDELPTCEANTIPPEIWLTLTGYHREDGEEWYRSEVRIPDSVQRLKEQEAGEP